MRLYRASRAASAAAPPSAWASASPFRMPSFNCFTNSLSSAGVFGMAVVLRSVRGTGQKPPPVYFFLPLDFFAVPQMRPPIVAPRRIAGLRFATPAA